MAAGLPVPEPSTASVVWPGLHWVGVASRNGRLVALAMAGCLIACTAGCSGLLTSQSGSREKLVEPEDISRPVEFLVATKVQCETCGWEVYLLAPRPVTVHRCPVCGWEQTFSTKTEGIWQTLPFEGSEDVIFFSHELSTGQLERLSNPFLPERRVKKRPQGIHFPSSVDPP